MQSLMRQEVWLHVLLRYLLWKIPFALATISRLDDEKKIADWHGVGLECAVKVSWWRIWGKFVKWSCSKLLPVVLCQSCYIVDWKGRSDPSHGSKIGQPCVQCLQNCEGSGVWCVDCAAKRNIKGKSRAGINTRIFRVGSVECCVESRAR